MLMQAGGIAGLGDRRRNAAIGILVTSPLIAAGAGFLATLALSAGMETNRRPDDTFIGVWVGVWSGVALVGALVSGTLLYMDASRRQADATAIATEWNAGR